MFWMRACLGVVAIVVFAGCAPADGGDPAEVVENYLEAKVSGDREAMINLLCTEMEAELTRESSSFANVEASIEGMDCSRVGDSDQVACSGEIVIVYDTENRGLPLTEYRVVNEFGEWRWCGEVQSVSSAVRD